MKYFSELADFSYDEIIESMEVIKERYRAFVASFFYFDQKRKVEFMRYVKNVIYSLKFETWKKDQIWECLND